jgi:hypothetical protein
MDRPRHGVILLILLALAGGIWTRHLHTRSGFADTLVEIRPAFENAGFRLVGTFVEPIGNLTGFEVSFPNCSRPLAILPVSAGLKAVTPTGYRYRRGDYDISYIYNGNVYPEDWISYKLGLLNYSYRFQSLFGFVEAKQFAYFFKIWIPTGCRGISNAEASALESALLWPIGHKDV